MKKNFIIIGLILLLVLAAGIYFFMQKYPSLNNSNSELASSNILSLNVEISGYKFFPQAIAISQGGIITWTNNDSVAHTITSDSGTELASPLIASGSSYSHKFDTKGIFDYHCSIHPYMKGEVSVN